MGPSAAPEKLLSAVVHPLRRFRDPLSYSKEVALVVLLSTH